MPVWWLLVPKGWRRAYSCSRKRHVLSSLHRQCPLLSLAKRKCSLGAHPQQQYADWRNKLGHQAHPGVGTHRCAHSAA